MTARVSTKVGDVFFAKLGDYKRYFQYVANDRTQLNSDVIVAFKKKYAIDENPDLSVIVSGEVDFYAHCVTKLGVKMGLWEKIGNAKEMGDATNVIFRSAADYARKAGEAPIEVSEKWYVWKINDKDFTFIGKLRDEYMKSYVGLVMNPNGIIELLKGHKYPSNYPD